MRTLATRVRRSSPAFALNQRRLRIEARRGAPAGTMRSVRGHSRPVIALTYDDGPSPANTPELLEILGSSGAQATFFVVGSEIIRHAELAAQTIAAGHELGNHSFSHADPRDLADDALREEVERGAWAIAEAAGHSSLYRPPFGKRPRRVARVAAGLGFVTVLWSVDSGDTMPFSSERIAREVIDRVEPGDIVLMHDGGQRRQRTLDATRHILRVLTRRGYRFVTVSELLGHGDESNPSR